MWSPRVSVFPSLQLPGAKDFLKSQSERSNKRSYGEETGVCIACGGTPPPNQLSGAAAGVVGVVGPTVVGRPQTQETETSFLRPSSSPSENQQHNPLKTVESSIPTTTRRKPPPPQSSWSSSPLPPTPSSPKELYREAHPMPSSFPCVRFAAVRGSTKSETSRVST